MNHVKCTVNLLLKSNRRQTVAIYFKLYHHLQALMQFNMNTLRSTLSTRLLQKVIYVYTVNIFVSLSALTNICVFCKMATAAALQERFYIIKIQNWVAWYLRNYICVVLYSCWCIYYKKTLSALFLALSFAGLLHSEQSRFIFFIFCYHSEFTDEKKSLHANDVKSHRFFNIFIVHYYHNDYFLSLYQRRGNRKHKSDCYSSLDFSGSFIGNEWKSHSKWKQKLFTHHTP